MTEVPREVRSRSFGEVSEAYERFRPGPPAEALDWMLPAGANDVVDIGAGTGALTRLLVERVAHVTAIEPDARMRAVLAERVPQATAVDAVAEALPVPDASQDAVVAASAWHWVDPARAVPEVSRVLRPGGYLAVVWGGPNREDALWRDLRPDRVNESRIRQRRMLVLPEGSPFGPIEGPHDVPYARRFTTEEIVGLTGTFSEVIVMAAPDREELLRTIRERLAADARFDAPEGVELPMLARAWRAVRAA